MSSLNCEVLIDKKILTSNFCRVYLFLMCMMTRHLCMFSVMRSWDGVGVLTPWRDQPSRNWWKGLNSCCRKPPNMYVLNQHSSKMHALNQFLRLLQVYNCVLQDYLNLSTSDSCEAFVPPGLQRAQRLSSVGSSTASTQPLLQATNDVFLEHQSI